MGCDCLLTYSDENGVVYRMSREEFLGVGIQGGKTHLPFRVSVTEAASPQDKGFPGLESKVVSFYHMTDGSYIYSFTGVTFNGTLHP